MKTEQETLIQNGKAPTSAKAALSLSRKQLIAISLAIAVPFIAISAFGITTHTKLQTTKADLQSTTENLQEANTQNQTLTEEKEGLETTVSSKDEAIEQQRQALADKEDELAEKEKTLQEGEAALARSRSQLSTEQGKTALLDSNIRVLKNCMEGMAGAFIAIAADDTSLALASMGRIEGTCEDAGEIVEALD